MVARLNHISNPWGSSFDTSGMSFLNIAHSPLDMQNLQKTQEANDWDRFALPADGRIEHLIEHYFSDVGLLFPNLHKPTFLECYAQMKRDGPINTRRIWLATLNMVLAMGTLTVMRGDSMAQNRAVEAQKYYERAVGLCDPIVLSGTSLEVGKWLQYREFSRYTTKLMFGYSPISHTRYPLSPGDTHFRPDKQHAGYGNQYRFPHWSALTTSLPDIPSPGKRDAQSDMVRLHNFRQVNIPDGMHGGFSKNSQNAQYDPWPSSSDSIQLRQGRSAHGY